MVQEDIGVRIPYRGQRVLEQAANDRAWYRRAAVAHGVGDAGLRTRIIIIASESVGPEQTDPLADRSGRSDEQRDQE